MSVILDNSTISLIKEKLDSIEKKVDREIHGGNGKGLWEEVREVRGAVETLTRTVSEMKTEFSKHTGKHLGESEAEEVSIQIRRLWIAAIGLLITVGATVFGIIRLLIEH